MKTIFFSLLLFFSVNSFSQTYVSNLTKSYLVDGLNTKLIGADLEQNIFSVKNGYLVWENHEGVQYRIKDIKINEGDLYYFLKGNNDVSLIFVVKTDVMYLVFDGDDGNKYALKFY
jgi:hypothetical protein